MKKVLRSNFFYGFLAFLFALLLFFNANSDTPTRVTQSAQNYDTTVYDVPVEVEYNEKSYYISGFPNTVTVHLSSLNRVKLAQEANKETRTFKVTADLTKQKEGTVDVMLRATNLISGVEAVIDPAVISVTVEKKETKEFKVEPVLDESYLKEGYKVENIKLSKEYVSVTTGKETMKQISSIQGKLSAQRDIVDDFKEEVLLQAVDSKGNVLPVTIEPQRVMATVTIASPQKKISLEFQQMGILEPSITRFQFESSETEVMAKGPQSLLDGLATLKLPIDITGIKEKVEIEVPVTSEEPKLSFAPKNVTVTVIPVFSTEDIKENTPSSSQKKTSSSEKKKEESSSSESKEKTSHESSETKESAENKKE